MWGLKFSSDIKLVNSTFIAMRTLEIDDLKVETNYEIDGQRHSNQSKACFGEVRRGGGGEAKEIFYQLKGKCLLVQ